MVKPRKLLLLLMMLLLPLQGLAASTVRMQMTMGAMGAPEAEAMPCHEQPAADAGMNGTAHDPDTANHLCCHQVLSCMSLNVLNTPAQKFSDISRFVLPLATLFIPESPDRPPRG